MSDGFYDEDDEEEERPSRKRARRRDPDTSKQAIEDKTAADIREAIIRVMRATGRPMTAEEINDLVPVDGQSGNPRYNELHEDGVICTDGKRAKNRSGKEAILWRLASPREGAFLREQSAGGFPANDALSIELEATPDILKKIWPFLNQKQKDAYNGRVRKDDWAWFKRKNKGIKAYMRAYGVDDEDDSK